MSDEGRLFLKDDADKTKACFYCGEPESHGVDHCMGVLHRLRAQLATITAERDEARRFLREAGDEMRARWNAINESLATNRALQATADRYRGALADVRALGGVGTAAQIARRALADTSPPARPAAECAWCRKSLTVVEAKHLTVCSPCWDANCRGREAFASGTALRNEALAKMAADFPYWHPADKPCPVSALTPGEPGATCGTCGGRERIGGWAPGATEPGDEPCPDCTPSPPRPPEDHDLLVGGCHCKHCEVLAEQRAREDARRAAARSPEAKACASWCGWWAGDLPDEGVYWAANGQGFCSIPCHRAGKALNPRAR